MVIGHPHESDSNEDDSDDSDDLSNSDSQTHNEEWCKSKRVRHQYIVALERIGMILNCPSDSVHYLARFAVSLPSSISATPVALPFTSKTLVETCSSNC